MTSVRSAARRIVTICSSVYRRVFRRSSFVGIHLHRYQCPGSRGAGQQQMAFRYAASVGTSEKNRALMAGRFASLSTLCAVHHATLRRIWGQRASLCLHHTGLSSLTPCRLLGTLAYFLSNLWGGALWLSSEYAGSCGAAPFAVIRPNTSSNSKRRTKPSLP